MSYSFCELEQAAYVLLLSLFGGKPEGASGIESILDLESVGGVKLLTGCLTLRLCHIILPHRL